MRRTAPLAAMLAFASSALAQPQPPVAPQRPAFSPYLNLVNRGTSPGFNYLGIVRPQLRFQQQFGQLQQELRQTNQSLQDLENSPVYGADPNLPLSGHAAVFNNTGHYFNSNPAFGGGAFGAGSARPTGLSGGTGQLPRPTGPGGGSSRSSFGSGLARPAFGGGSRR